MSRVISLYGGPGTGKSTSAAYLFSKLKMDGNNAELVREYVKDWVWEGRKMSDYDQIYFLGKQIRRESMLYGKVDNIVTDSPVMLAAFYSEKYSPAPIKDAVDLVVKNYYEQAANDGHQHVHVFLLRSKGYEQAGRYQDEQTARLFDTEIYNFLSEQKVRIFSCGTAQEDLNLLLDVI